MLHMSEACQLAPVICNYRGNLMLVLYPSCNWAIFSTNQFKVVTSTTPPKYDNKSLWQVSESWPALIWVKKDICIEKKDKIQSKISKFNIAHNLKSCLKAWVVGQWEKKEEEIGFFFALTCGKKEGKKKYLESRAALLSYFQCILTRTKLFNTFGCITEAAKRKCTYRRTLSH